MPTSSACVRRGLVLGLMVALTLPFGAAEAQRSPMRGPDALPDLVEQTIDTVVNISTTSRVAANRQVPNPQMPQLPPGSPFQEFFEEFFGRRGEGGPNRPQAPDGAPNQPPQQQQRRQSSLGSGFIIDAAGIIVTNNHVIANADEITAIFHDGSRLRATVVGRDAATDLAVLRVEVPTGRTLRAARWGDSDTARIGEWVMAIGNPLGFGGTVTAGILSARNRDINSGRYDNFLQTDAPINRGNSGGPLFNMNGEVIGINTAIVSPSGGSIGIGFAIPSNLARNVVAQLQEFGEARRGWLGVSIQNITDEIAESLRLPNARGALVSRVQPDGPAGRAGLQTGDVIVRFGERQVADTRELQRIVADTPAGREIPVAILRNGQPQTVQVTVGRLEEGEQRQARAQPDQPAPPPPPANQPVLGMALSGITTELRRQYRLPTEQRGVVVTRVEPGSSAAERGIQPGNVIVEVAQEAVNAPEDVDRRVAALRNEGRRSVLFLIANAQGELRFVGITIAQ
jgi:serine protease Do